MVGAARKARKKPSIMGWRTSRCGHGSAKSRRTLAQPTHASGDLTQPEHVAVVDRERHRDHMRPAGGEQGPQRGLCGLVVDPPEHRGDGPPLPEHQRQDNGGREDVRRALDVLRHDGRQSTLERLRAMTLCCTANNPSSSTSITTAATAPASGSAAIDSARHQHARQEEHGVDEHHEECQVGHASVRPRRLQRTPWRRRPPRLRGRGRRSRAHLVLLVAIDADTESSSGPSRVSA